MKEWIEFTGNGALYILTILQTNEVFQIVELCISILLSIILIAYKIWKWYREAMKDGKITKDEIDEIVDEVGKDIEDIKKKGDKDE